MADIEFWHSEKLQSWFAYVRLSLEKYFDIQVIGWRKKMAKKSKNCIRAQSHNFTSIQEAI